MSNVSTATALTEAVRAVVGPDPAPLHEPTLGALEESLVTDCLRSTFVSSVGQYVRRLEELFEQYTGAQHAVATVSGTSALQVALRLAGVGPGDEVIVPSLSFVATANAVAHLGALPHFVDIEPETLGVDPHALRRWLDHVGAQTGGQLHNRLTGRPIRAIVPVHVFGHPCDIEGLSSLAQERGLALVEDAAESLGSTLRERHTGTFGLLGAVSMNGNKIITAGGGGMILTDDAELAARAKHLTTTAKVAHAWDFVHDEIGYNYRMPNINAALAVAQFARLSDFVSAKRSLYERYATAFNGVSGVRLLREPVAARSNYWLQTLQLDDPEVLPQALNMLNAAGYGARPVWRPLHTLAPYRSHPQAPLEVTMDLAGRLLNLPSSQSPNAGRVNLEVPSV